MEPTTTPTTVAPTGAPPAAPAAASPGSPATGHESPGLVNADGTFTEGWLSHGAIEADLRSDKTLGRVKSVGEMARMLVNAEKILGNKRSVIPTDPADTKTIDAYFRAVGWPESPDKYPELKPPANLPEGMKPNDEMTRAFRSWCHEARLTPEQVQHLAAKVWDWNIAEHNNALAEQAKAVEEGRSAFRTKYGPRADAMLQFAGTFASAFSAPEALERMKAKGYLEDPDVLELCIAGGQAVSPDRLHARSDGSADAASIQSKIDELMASDAYRDARNPRHAAIQAQVEQLFNQLGNTRQSAA